MRHSNSELVLNCVASFQRAVKIVVAARNLLNTLAKSGMESLYSVPAMYSTNSTMQLMVALKDVDSAAVDMCVHCRLVWLGAEQIVQRFDYSVMMVMGLDSVLVVLHEAYSAQFRLGTLASMELYCTGSFRRFVVVGFAVDRLVHRMMCKRLGRQPMRLNHSMMADVIGALVVVDRSCSR